MKYFLVVALTAILTTIVVEQKHEANNIKDFTAYQNQCAKLISEQEDFRHEMCNFYGAYEYLNLCNPPNDWIKAYYYYKVHKCVREKFSQKNF